MHGFFKTQGKDGRRGKPTSFIKHPDAAPPGVQDAQLKKEGHGLLAQFRSYSFRIKCERLARFVQPPRILSLLEDPIPYVAIMFGLMSTLSTCALIIEPSRTAVCALK